MKNIAIKKVFVQQFKAICEQDVDGWKECIVIYDEMGEEIARSKGHHPESWKSFYYNGFEFISSPYSGREKKECYVKVIDNLFFEVPND
jgi:hypothetical protein